MYDAIVNYAGNGFVEKSWEMITENNPFNIGTDIKSQTVMNSLAGFLSSASGNIKIGKPQIKKAVK